MSVKSKKPLILVDGSSYLFRAYHALPPLTNSKGEPTGAIYGVLNMLRKLQRDYQPDYMAVIFDPKGKTFRHEIYKLYKANRTAMPDELRVQIKPLFDAIKALGLPLVVEEEVEADDVIASSALQAQQTGLSTIVSTGDKDLAQIVNKDITLINTMTDKKLDIKGVQEKFGVGPELIIDYLTLIGDSVDNIPGIPKVGPKTAAKWLNEYGSLDNIITNADKITGKVGESLRAHLKDLPLSKELITIKKDLTLSYKPQDLIPGEWDKKQLKAIFSKLEFKKWLMELQDSATTEAAKVNYQTILSEKAFATWLKKLNKAKVIAFDTETTSLDSMRAKLVGVSFAIEPGEAAYVPLQHDYENAPKQLPQILVLEKLKLLLGDTHKTIVGQNLKYDLKILRNNNIEVSANLKDTLLESYVLNSSSSRHDLDTLALKYLARNTIKFTDIAGTGVKQLTFNQIPLEQASPYAAEDADITLQLHNTLMPLIQAEQNLTKVFNNIEMPLMPILMNMEYRGVLINAKMLQQQSQQLAKRIDEIEQKTHQLAGKVFNLGSPKQLQEILFNELQLPILKKTPKGQPSTAEDVLQDLALDYPLPKLILEYRSLSKLKSTYTDKLPQQINPKTGRVHTHYHQAVTATGRLSSSDPNLQNIPARTDAGRKIREAFVAPKGYQILAADYSQVELRIMAHLSKDPGLLAAFEKNLDVHAATASEVFGVDIKKVTAEQRRRAKAINFGLMYGMSSFGLAKQLGIPRQAAQEYIDVYFQRYPKVYEYMESARAKAALQGYVETIMGRRLATPDIKASNIQRRRAAERAAINAPLQGTAADIIKLAMIKTADWIKTNQHDIYMIMQVHDELVFEVPKNLISVAKKNIKQCMESAAELSVPLIVAIGVGENWNEAHS